MLKRKLDDLFQKTASQQNDDSVTRLLLEAFSMQHEYQIHDFFCSLILSECVYKAVDAGHTAALAALTTFRDQFPIGTVPLERAQFCRRRVDHRYMLAIGGGALYVAFMGTKELRDVVVDAAVGKRVLRWAGREGEGETAAGAGAAAGIELGAGLQAPSVHGGFLNRADGIPVESLYLHARRAGLRLVLCGHSLGGAVAILATLRLLATLPATPPLGDVQCICFGTPPFASNAALEKYISDSGWTGHFTSYALPDDPIPRLLLGSGTTRQPAMPAVTAVPAGDEGSTRIKASNNAVVDALLVVQAEEEKEEAAEGKEEDGGNSPETTTKQPVLSSSSSSSSAWTVGTTLKAVVRNTAGVVRLPAVPIPTFAHFGDPLYLLPSGVSSTVSSIVPQKYSSTATTAPNASTRIGEQKQNNNQNNNKQEQEQGEQGEGVLFVDEGTLQQPRGWMSTHRMATYRARVQEIIRFAAIKNGVQLKVEEGGVIEAAVLLPDPQPVEALALLPVLWRGTSTSTSINDKAILADVSPAPTAQSSQPASWMWPWNKLTGSIGSAGTTGLPPTTATGTLQKQQQQQQHRRPGLPATCTLQVSVCGNSLDLCTGAVIHFSKGVVVEGEIVKNDARQQILNEVRALSSMTTHMGATQPPPSLFQNLRSKLLPQAQAEGPKIASQAGGVSLHISTHISTQPDLMLRFIVPTSAIVQLQPGLGSNASPLAPAPAPAPQGSPTLILFSDFGKGTSAVTLRSQTAWMLPIEPLVGRDAFEKLRQSAGADAEEAARAAQSGSFASRLPQFLFGSRRSATPVVEQQPSIPAETQQEEDEDLMNKTPFFSFSGLRSRAVKTLQGLWHRSNKLSSLTESLHPMHTVPAVLLRGVAILDAFFALEGLDQPTETLSLAANLLKWKAEQQSLSSLDISRGPQAPASGSSSATVAAAAAAAADNSKEPTSIDDAFWDLPSSDLNNSGLDLGRRIRNRIKQATNSVRRRNALLRRWQAFRALPAPDVVVVVLGTDTLAPPSGNSNPSTYTQANTESNPLSPLDILNVDVLNSIQAVVSAASKCHAAVLLAVASPEARDASFRRRLSFSTGLHGRPGAVVPLLLVSEGDGGNTLGTRLLEAAVLAHASLAAQNEQRQQRLQEGGGIFRARL